MAITLLPFDYSRPCLYVIHAPTSGHCKIGIARNPRRRMATLQTGHHERLEMVLASEFEDAKKIEQIVHRMLRHKRTAGEWFAVTPIEAHDAIKIANVGLLRPDILARWKRYKVSRPWTYGIKRSVIRLSRA